MADDGVQVGCRCLQLLCHCAEHVAIRGAVEAVAPNAMQVVPLLWHCVAVGFGRHRRMEASVEDGHVGNATPYCLGGHNSREVGRIVEGRQATGLLNSSLYLGIDHGWGAELDATVHDPVANHFDSITGFLWQTGKDPLQPSNVILHHDLFSRLGQTHGAMFMGPNALFPPNALNNAFAGQAHCLILHLVNPILDAGTPRIQYQRLAVRPANSGTE
mmetsp:Transcript_66941/g.145961  ORF Transcript_66941/g.145961 Transcript_66941/m.145961 type:complete len:216 (+) Transcript_66941:820-1467(+)